MSLVGDFEFLKTLVIIAAYTVYWVTLVAWTFFKWKLIIAVAIPIAVWVYKYLASRPRIRSRY